MNNKIRVTASPLCLDTNMMALTVISDDLTSDFLFYTLDHAKLYRIADTSTIPQLNNKHINPFRIDLPPLPEQQKIAAILSTWDRAIELTEKLIAAEQRRKQALMQQLLTGKVRLPKSKGKWKRVKTGSIFKKRSERGLPDLPTLSVTIDRGLIRRDSIDRKMDTTLDAEQHLLVRKGDIAYNMMRMWQGASGLAQEDGIVSPAYVVLTATDEIDSLFASYLFKLPHTIKQFLDYSFGLTSDRLRLYYKDFSAISLRIPSVTEQRRIVEILVAHDMELAMLEKRSSLLSQQKVGLMQQLLAGQIRVSGVIADE